MACVLKCYDLLEVCCAHFTRLKFIREIFCFLSKAFKPHSSVLFISSNWFACHVDNQNIYFYNWTTMQIDINSYSLH